jgi:hypothetical protein
MSNHRGFPELKNRRISTNETIAWKRFSLKGGR